jgi:hypothetical protein
MLEQLADALAVGKLSEDAESDRIAQGCEGGRDHLERR